MQNPKGNDNSTTSGPSYPQLWATMRPIDKEANKRIQSARRGATKDKQPQTSQPSVTISSTSDSNSNNIASSSNAASSIDDLVNRAKSLTISNPQLIGSTNSTTTATSATTTTSVPSGIGKTIVKPIENPVSSITTSTADFKIYSPANNNNNNKSESAPILSTVNSAQYAGYPTTPVRDKSPSGSTVVSPPSSSTSTVNSPNSSTTGSYAGYPQTPLSSNTSTSSNNSASSASPSSGSLLDSNRSSKKSSPANTGKPPQLRNQKPIYTRSNPADITDDIERLVTVKMREFVESEMARDRAARIPHIGVLEYIDTKEVDKNAWAAQYPRRSERELMFYDTVPVPSDNPRSITPGTENTILAKDSTHINHTIPMKLLCLFADLELVPIPVTDDFTLYSSTVRANSLDRSYNPQSPVLYGKADYICYNKRTREYVIIDIKTITPGPTNMMDIQDMLGRVKYAAQLNIYKIIFNELLSRMNSDKRVGKMILIGIDYVYGRICALDVPHDTLELIDARADGYRAFNPIAQHISVDRLAVGPKYALAPENLRETQPVAPANEGAEEVKVTTEEINALQHLLHNLQSKSKK